MSQVNIFYPQSKKINRGRLCSKFCNVKIVYFKTKGIQKLQFFEKIPKQKFAQKWQKAQKCLQILPFYAIFVQALNVFLDMNIVSSIHFKNLSWKYFPETSLKGIKKTSKVQKNLFANFWQYSLKACCNLWWCSNGQHVVVVIGKKVYNYGDHGVVVMGHWKLKWAVDFCNIEQVTLKQRLDHLTTKMQRYSRLQKARIFFRSKR